MKASEAKIKAVWNSIPEVIRSKIQDMVGYRAECSECYTVNATDLHSDPSSIVDDIKLTITW
jgi:hypothetical protein